MQRVDFYSADLQAFVKAITAPAGFWTKRMMRRRANLSILLMVILVFEMGGVMNILFGGFLWLG
jgi:hypothetical protein